MAATQSELKPILDKVPGWKTTDLDVQPLAGGITNRNYLVTAGQDRYVLRVAGERTELLGIDRESEYEASRIAGKLGIGAEVVAFLPEERVLVTRFIAGKGLTAEKAAEPETVRRIVAAMRDYHEGPAFPVSFSPFETVRSYYRLAREHGVAFPESTSAALETLWRIEESLGKSIRVVPCHNDLLAANFIDDGKRLRILDWEYAGMGDLFFDLGNFAVNQEFDPSRCEFLVECYFGDVTKDQLTHLHSMRLASDMRESFWGFLQSGISKLDFDFHAYGCKHLERFREAAAAL